MGVVFGVIWAADCNNAIRFNFRPPAKGHPPPAVKPIFKRDERYIVVAHNLWVSILGLFGSLISKVPSDFTSGAPPAARRHNKILRKQQIYPYGYRF